MANSLANGMELNIYLPILFFFTRRATIWQHLQHLPVQKSQLFCGSPLTQQRQPVTTWDEEDAGTRCPEWSIGCDSLPACLETVQQSKTVLEMACLMRSIFQKKSFRAVITRSVKCCLWDEKNEFFVEDLMFTSMQPSWSEQLHKT